MKKIKLDKGKVVDFIDYEEIEKNIQSQYERELIINSITDEVIDVILRKGEEEWSKNEMQKIILRKQADDKRDKALQNYNDYYDVIESEYIGREVGEFEILISDFEIVDSKSVKQVFKIVKSEQKINQKIKELKSSLSSTDYKIVKIYEAKVLNTESPYSQEEINAIISERQSFRDRINELEMLL